jgi:hypothetical protein
MRLVVPEVMEELMELRAAELVVIKLAESRGLFP